MQIVIKPEDYPKEKYLKEFIKIRDAIINGRIEPFISETIFTIEAIRKVERQDFFSSQKPKFKYNISEKGNAISININMGQNKDDAIYFNKRPILKKFFDEAIKLGFKIIDLPRIGGLINSEVEKVRDKLEGKYLEDYQAKVFEVAEKIESKGAGISKIESIRKKYGNSNWMKELKKAPQKDRKKIAKAAAEWADGDSVAISIAIGCDYFCTRDRAKGAGNKSVLSIDNLKWLKKEYNFNPILPKFLAKKISE